MDGDLVLEGLTGLGLQQELQLLLDDGTRRFQSVPYISNSWGRYPNPRVATGAD